MNIFLSIIQFLMFLALLGLTAVSTTAYLRQFTPDKIWKASAFDLFVALSSLFGAISFYLALVT